MKIKELLYKTPEMTEEKLCTIMDSHYNWLKKDFRARILSLHKGNTLSQALLKEYDLVNDKNSNLTKSQRDIVIGFVGTCMFEMTKNDGKSGEH